MIYHRFRLSRSDLLRLGKKTAATSENDRLVICFAAPQPCTPALDGGRGFSSLSRQQRWLAVAAIAAAWFLTAESLLLLLLIAGGNQALHSSAPQKPDRIGLAQYVSLVGIPAALCMLPVPVGKN